eukprot:UN25847
MQITNTQIVCPLPTPLPIGSLELSFDHFAFITGIFPARAPPNITVSVYGHNFPDSSTFPILLGNEYIVHLNACFHCLWLYSCAQFVIA